MVQKPDQKFAMHLSGGFDSSILARIYDRPDADYFHVRGPETEKAKALGKVLEGRLHILDVTDEEFMEAAEATLGDYSEPECDAAGVLAYIASREAKKMGHDLVVTGDCADTILGGHTWGPHSEKAVDVWKTLEPNNLLGLKTLMPFGHPGLKAWVKATLKPELVDYNKQFLRKFAVELGLPDIITQQKKIGWGGCWEYPKSQIVADRMQASIESSPFGWLKNLTHYKREYSLFRLYALVLWLEKKYRGDATRQEDYPIDFFEKENGYPETSPYVEIYAKQRIRAKLDALMQEKNGRLIFCGSDAPARALLFFIKEDGFPFPDIIIDEESQFREISGVPVLDVSKLEWKRGDTVLLGSRNNRDKMETLLRKSGFRGKVVDLERPLINQNVIPEALNGVKEAFSCLSELPRQSKLIIYGAGEAGRRLFNRLQDVRKDVNVLFFLDTYKEGEFCGKRIVPIKKFLAHNASTTQYDRIIVASMYHEEIEKLLIEHRIDEYIIYRPEMNKNRWSVDPDSENYQKLKALEGRHRNQRCFIIGNGPSLKSQDLDRLKSEITFSSNRIHMIFDQTQWRPTYYYADHHEIIQEDLGIINSLPESVTKLFPTRIQKMNIPINDAIYFELVWDVFYPDKPKFSMNALDRLYWGSTVTYSLIQLACHMGIREIYLLGVDCKFTVPLGNEKGDHKFKVVQEMRNNHFHPDYSKIGSMVFPPNIERHHLSYRSAREAIESAGGKILNATRGGDLEVFERVDFDGLF